MIKIVSLFYINLIRFMISFNGYYYYYLFQ